MAYKIFLTALLFWSISFGAIRLLGAKFSWEHHTLAALILFIFSASAFVAVCATISMIWA